MANNTEGVVATPCPIHKSGRPRTGVSPGQVKALLDEGKSLRTAALILKIGVATASRLRDAAGDVFQNPGEPFQNSRPGQADDIGRPDSERPPRALETRPDSGYK